MRVGTLSWLRWILFAMTLLTAAEAAAAGDGHVYKFTSARRLGVSGRDHLVVIAEPPTGGHSVRLVVPNTTSDKYAPTQEAADAIKGLQFGSLIQVQTHADGGAIIIETIGAWSPRPGEDTPHGYVFIQAQSSDKPGDLRVILTKYGETFDAIAPAEPDAQGSPAPNAAINAELKQVHEGDVVWADVAPGKPATLSAILPWADPQTGKLLRVAAADVDGQRGFAAEIATDAKPITALIPMKFQDGKWIPDPKLLAAAHKPQSGSDVLFRTREDADKTWLLEIEPPSKDPQVAQRKSQQPPPAGIPVRSTGGAGNVPGLGGLPGGF
jgi:hypothetical protein